MNEIPSRPVSRPARRWSGWPLVPLLLAVLALLDLRLEFRLLADHFTFTALGFLVRSHPLAVSVLLLQPSLWHHYR